MLFLTATVLMSLTVVAGYLLGTSRTEFDSSITATQRSQATYLAEAGFNLALSQLHQMWPLSARALPLVVLPSTSLGRGSYTVQLLNNPQDPGGAYDTDGLYILRETAKVGTRGTRRVIDSYIRARAGNDLLNVPCALALGTGDTARVNGSGLISGYDAVAGIATTAVCYESSGQTLTTSGGATVTGSPDYTWATGIFAPTLKTSREMVRAARILSEMPAAVHMTAAKPLNLGTTTSPQISIVDPGSDYSYSGNTTGAGILVVRGKLKWTGNFTFRGLILLDESGQLSDVGGAGSINLYGAFFVTPPRQSGTLTNVLTMSGSSSIHYSRSDVAVAAGLMPSVRVLSQIGRN